MIVLGHAEHCVSVGNVVVVSFRAFNFDDLFILSAVVGSVARSVIHLIVDWIDVVFVFRENWVSVVVSGDSVLEPFRLVHGTS